MESHAYRKHYRVLLLLLPLVVALFLAFPKPVFADEAGSDRYITITVHAGANGYFGDPAVTEIETTQLRGDVFYLTTEPDAIDDSLTFMGWATTPDATEVDVISGETSVNGVGTDIYAVWSDKVHVIYRCTDGYILIDNVEYEEVNMEYQVGDLFRDIAPEPYDPQLKFGGWYTGMNGKGTRYTSDTAITESEVVLFAHWVLNPDVIPEIEEDTDYPVTVSGSGLYYAFTPQETAVYEIFTSAIDGSAQAYVRLLDKDMNDLMDSTTTDVDGNVALSTELTAGQTYYFQLRSLNGSALSYTARLQRAEEAAVNFHVNHDNAWFDGDHFTTEKTIRVKAGEDISSYSKSGLEFDTKQPIVFLGWSVDPNASRPDSTLPAQDGLDVYAVYQTSYTFLLDANGGYFPRAGNAATRTISYQPGEYFVTDYDPAINDNTKKFAGWATTPDATEPNIVEGQTLCSDLGDVIYAVYADKVVVTFETNEGYMMDDPSITTFQATFGKGHIFYGLALMHDDSRMTPLAWKDQNGNTVPYTSEFYPLYQIFEDTTFTAVWGKGVVVDANGGYFFDDPELDALRITFYIDDPFNSGDITNLVGDPTIDDSEKVLAGWATTADATEPDVIDGETDIMGLSRIYAVWKAKAVDPDDDDDDDGGDDDDDDGDDGDDSDSGKDSPDSDEDDSAADNTDADDAGSDEADSGKTDSDDSAEDSDKDAGFVAGNGGSGTGGGSGNKTPAAGQGTSTPATGDT